ncbi:MAG TPA: SMP-30/gluconolactonase/LRE family protein [Steroidobacteraceae bacterium]|nr:SMP-30/gluconolactonase/LRE family protein [Steroidobacteraceae bacterium]
MNARLRAVKNLWGTLKWVGALVALTLAVFGVDSLRFGGAFRSVQPAFAGACRAIPLGGSSEDLQLDRDRGLAYLSFLDRDTLSKGEKVKGTVMLLDLNQPDPVPRAAMIFDPADFRPHGLSLLKAGTGPARLFAISHLPDGRHTVEVAEEGSSGGFFPKETIRDPAFIHPNAIAATGPRAFYLANDTTDFGRWAQVKQTRFRSGSATLVYFDGTKARVEITGLAFVAGVALSPDASRLYVAETLAKALRVYRRDTSNGTLSLEEVVDLDAAPDNLNVDGDGVVWIAAHPKLLRFIGHVRDSAQRAPTQVLRFDPRQSGDSRLTQVYLNDGDEISAGTVAARWRDEFLIGALLDKKVLICKPIP